MSARTWLGWLVGGVLGAFAGLGALHLPVDLSPFSGNGTVLGSPAPGFNLANAATGVPISLAAEQGRPVVLAFVDVALPSARVPAAVLDAAAHRLGRNARRVAWMVINTDPWPASRAEVVAWARENGMPSPVTVVTGNVAELAAVWQSYGVNVSIIGGRTAYTAGVYVLAPDLTEELAMALNLRGGRQGIAAAGARIAWAVRDAEAAPS